MFYLLKSGYHHVEIFHNTGNYLAFSWDFGDGGDGVVKYFQLTVHSRIYSLNYQSPFSIHGGVREFPRTFFLTMVCLGGGVSAIKDKINSLTVFALI